MTNEMKKLPQSPKIRKDVYLGNQEEVMINWSGVQQRIPRTVRGWGLWLCEERLRAQGLLSWEQKRLCGNLIGASQCLQGVLW